MRERIYMDHASTTPVDPRVIKEMLPYFDSRFGDALSFHSRGQDAGRALETSRKCVASLINSKPEEIIFTSGGTESNNLALTGIALANKREGRRIITSQIEHHSILNVCKSLEKSGFKVVYLPVDEHGLIDPKDVESAITNDTILVSIMHANHEIGTIQPVEEIGKVARENDVIFHTDAVQSAGKIPIDVEKMNVDALSLAAHNFYGPKGVGCLFLRRDIKLEPMMKGGPHEGKLRPGTRNLPGIVGLGKAAEIAKSSMESDSKRLTKLRDELIKGILEIKDSKLNGHSTKRLPENANFCFKFIEGESLVMKLNFEGIEVSTGSGCASESLEPNHVLKAIGLRDEEIHGSLRMTLGRDNDEGDVQRVLRVLPPIVKELRRISPFKRSFD